MTTRTKSEEVKMLRAENFRLREICKDLHWMSRRYADGRSTYAPTMVNDAVDYLLKIGVELNNCDGTLLAGDGKPLTPRLLG